ncbi:MAG: hypothetical protein H6741_20800 [Alphaproteobacteria bacterium]|nr:hypothetical protein [Alphaproteobacteria bacterium]MCB9795149.1 hypothetical protein [Alphaproteobacteria bacterium]
MRRWTPLLPGLLALALALARAPLVSPDGVEMAAAGRCLWMNLGELGACVGTEPLYWPPAFPLLSGLAALLLAPDAAAVLTSLLAMSLLAWPLTALARRVGGELAALLVLPILVAAPALRAHALMGDARPLALLGLFGACALALDPRRSGLGVGALLGLACLSRPEALAPAGLLLLWMTWTERRRLPAALGAFALLFLPYIALLSVQAGQLTLTARGWQSAAYGWLAWMPEPWAQMELAAGSWGTPLRAWLSTSSLASGSPGEAGSLLSWAGYALGRATPMGLVLLVVVGIMENRTPRTLSAIAAVSLPAVAIALLPQARDPLLPANNLLPLLLGLVVLGAGAAERLAERGRWALGAAVFLVAVSNWSFPDPRGEDPEQGGVAEAPALPAGVDPGARVAASPDSATAVLVAGLPRTRLPPPWMVGPWLAGPERGDAVWVTAVDMPAAGRTLAELERRGALGAPLAVEGWGLWVPIR